MNKERRLELRKWSAELMGWNTSSHVNRYMTANNAYPVMDKCDWIPDTDLNQCFMVVEGMDKLHYGMKLMNPIHTMTGNESKTTWMVEFSKGGKGWFSFAKTPALAILLAAWATGVGRAG